MCDFLLKSDDPFILTEQDKQNILDISLPMGVKMATEAGIYYKYVYNTDRFGSELPPQRDFCREMVFRDKLYTKDEIDMMSFRGVNRKFGHKRRAYSIWLMRGGKNCRHAWMEIRIDIDEDTGLPVETTRKSVNSEGKVVNKLVNTTPVGNYK